MRGPLIKTDEVLKWLERKGTRRIVEGMARYGIRTTERVRSRISATANPTPSATSARSTMPK